MSHADDYLISDLHKDARGFRPDAEYIQRFNEMSEIDRDRVYEGLIAELDEELDRSRAAQAEAVEEFELELANLIVLGAADRATALRWLQEADCEPDTEHFLWGRGLAEHDFADIRRIMTEVGFTYLKHIEWRYVA